MKKAMVVLLGCALAFGFASIARIANAAPAIQAFDPDSMARIVQSQKGKPFALVIWSLDCQYCQTSLRALAREKRKHKQLKVITLATDPLDDTQAAALLRKRLEAAGLTADAWAFGSAAPERLRYAIDAGWHGEMPRSYWFNGAGERVPYSGVLTPAMITRLLTGS